jgi:thymidylate synthase (FAD)
MQGINRSPLHPVYLHLQQLHRCPFFNRLLEVGVAREQARKDLPLSTYTEAYWKIDLHNLLRFLQLRMDAHAQAEIRAYAQVIGEEIVARWVPITWEAFLDYQMNGLRLSQTEVAVIAAIASGQSGTAVELAADAGLLNRNQDGLRPNRERSELEAKLKQLGVAVPWNSDSSV